MEFATASFICLLTYQTVSTLRLPFFAVRRRRMFWRVVLLVAACTFN